MLVKALLFVSPCAALALGITLTHDLEIPGKHSLEVQNGLMSNILSMAVSPLWAG